MTARAVTVERNGRNVIVGKVENGVYVTKRDPDRHLFHAVGTEGGWGIDIDILLSLKCDGVRYVRVETPEWVYTAPIEAFDRWGKRIHVPGHGRQAVLRLKLWHADPVGSEQGRLI